MPKQLFFDESGRMQMQAGIQKLARLVGSTLGPKGRNVVLGRNYGKPSSTRDGVSVSKEIEFENPFESMGAKLVNEVATKTNKETGDGTTTSVVLAHAMIGEGGRYVASGVSPIALRNGIQKAVERTIKHLEGMARPVQGRDAIRQVAFVASNHDPQIADVMADAMDRVGPKGVVTVDKGERLQATLEFVDGVEFDKGFASPYFVNDPQSTSVRLKNPLLLITDQKLTGIRDLVPLLERVVLLKRPLFIVAEDVEGEALAGLIINRMRGILECVVIKAPAFGDRRKALLEDLAVLTGGTFLSKDLGFEWKSVTTEQLGNCQQIEVYKEKTIFFQGSGSARDIEVRKKQIAAQIEQSTSTYDREKLEERLGMLEGKIALIKVGGFTEAEMNERRERVDDALHATRAAMLEGIVPGGGLAFVRAIPVVAEVRAPGDERFGVEIVCKALARPLAVIADNAGLDGAGVVAEVEEQRGDVGFDAVQGKLTDLTKAGVVDPMKVLRVALQNAASIASMHLTSQVLITDIPKNKSAVAGATT